MAGMIHGALELAKRIVFVRGHLIYLMNIPSFRKSRKEVEARLHAQREANPEQKIRIGFILQVPNNWAVIQPVYEAAKADAAVEPVVLLMPELEFAHYTKLTKIMWEKTYAFGEKQCGADCVRCWEPETKTWKDPAELKLDYVFIPRPYETYLMKPWRASALRKICRTCYVPYSSPLIGDHPEMFNMHFIRNLHMVFCEKKHSYEYVAGRLRRTIRSGDQQAYNTGLPKFDLNHMEGAESAVWPRERKDGRLRVIWTPRWTTDSGHGGSNFLQYREKMIAWAEADASIDLVFRPHPLALKNYVASGAMTQEELDAYLHRFEVCENATIDRNPTYYETFWSSDILITDMSSVMMDYMCTGRPIIFCPSLVGKRMSDDPKFEVRDVIDGMYVERSFEDVMERVRKLAAGEDPKKETRAEITRTICRDGHIGRDILELIRADYRRV